MTRVVLMLILAFAAPAETQTETISRLFAEAREAQASDKYDVAVRKYQQIVRLSPSLAEAYANLGNSYYSLGRKEKAAAAFSKAIQLKPELTGPHFLLGVISFSSHSYEAALTHLKQAEKLDRTNPLIESYLGYSYYALSNYAEAARHLETAAALEEKDPDLLYHLSKAYAHLAKQFYQALHATFPDTLFDDLAQAHAHEAGERWEFAQQDYARALRKQPENARLQRKIEHAAAKVSGAKFEDDGPGDPTIDGSLELLRAPPAGKSLIDTFRSFIARAQALQNQGAKTAESIYTTAETYQALSYLASLRVVEDPDSYRTHQLTGEYLEASGKDEEAISEYLRALRQKPELPGVHFSIGNIFWKTNRLSEALPELRAELQIDPNHPQALYELGDALAEGGKTVEAEQCLIRASSLAPEMVEAHLALEKIYTARGEYEKSLAQLRKVLQVDSSSATPHYRMANIFRKLGRAREADKELEVFNQKKAGESKPSLAPQRP